MKIISLATTYPEKVDSILPKFVHLLNKEIAVLGHDVHVITPHIIKSKRFEILDGVRVHRFKYLTEKNQLNTESIPNTVNKSLIGKIKVIIMFIVFTFYTFSLSLRLNPRIIHGQWAFPSGFIAFLIGKITGARSIITIHYAEIPLLKNFKLLRKLVVYSLNKSDKVIAVSEFTRNELIDLGVSKNKIIKINPVPNFFHINKHDLKFNKLHNKKILFVGRLVERKGVEFLIQSLKFVQTEGIDVTIAGNGPLLEKLKNLVKNLGLSNIVNFVESPSDIELSKLFVSSGIFVCPSIVDSKGETEGLGLVVIEAMAAGLPVIASAVGGIKESIRTYENGILVEEKNPQQIAKAIDELITNYKLRETLIKNSRVKVSEFLPSRIAKQHEELYEKLSGLHEDKQNLA